MKRLLLPLAILLALVLVYLLVSNQKSRSVAPDRTSGFIEFDPEQLDSLIVTNKQRTLNFLALNEKWHILVNSRPRPADPAKMGEIISMLSRIDVGRVESDNPEKQAVYQVDSANGMLIRAFAGDQEVASFILGKNAQGYSYSYLRKTGSNDVYSARGVMAYRLDKPDNNWRDKSLLMADTSQLQTVDFKYNDDYFSLNKQDSLWYLSGAKYASPVEIAHDSMEVFKRLVADLKADDFFQPADSEFVDFQKPELTLTLKYANGRQESLIIYGGNSSQTRYYLSMEGSEEPYAVLSTKYSGLTRRPNNFVLIEKNG